MQIQTFKGQYRFLSNFYPARFEWRGLIWEYSECAYQAAKSFDPEDWFAIQRMSAADAKRHGRKLKIREDWELIKFSIMAEICNAKFSQNPELLAALKATGICTLQEGNTWGDKTWGVCPPGSGNGSNWLGLILMTLRAAL